MEMRVRVKEGRALVGWEEERKRFYDRKGWSLEEVEVLRDEGLLRGEELVRREKLMQEKERWNRIRESRYNKWYKMVIGEGVPGYLRNDWEEKRWQLVAGYRLEDRMRGGRYWEEGDKRSCRVCGRGVESWEHIWEECTDWGREISWQEMVMKVLGENGESEVWMKRVEEMRERASSGNGSPESVDE